MMESKKVKIIIPFYREKLTENEKISLLQCKRILGRYQLCIIKPDNLTLQVEEVQGTEVEEFDEKWFRSIQTYNNLMLSEKFYERFSDYDYILIYQLDAFVFYDRLEYFCNMDYDYIGAPWLYGAPYYVDSKHCTWYVGNGGFSLRKVSACIKLLNEQKSKLNDNGINEDMFFSMGKSDTFKVAPIYIALSFSFEQEVERCYRKNGDKLPFGCHAWERYNFDFWKPHIERFGYKVDLSDTYDGEDDKRLKWYYEDQRAFDRYMKYGYDKENLSAFLISIFGREFETIAVWGAGIYGRDICALLEEAGVEVDYILDNNPEKQNKIIYDHKVLSLDYYRKIKKRVSIIIGIKNHCMDVAVQLEKCGYRYKKDYIFYQDIINVSKEK